MRRGSAVSPLRGDPSPRRTARLGAVAVGLVATGFVLLPCVVVGVILVAEGVWGATALALWLGSAAIVSLLRGMLAWPRRSDILDLHLTPAAEPMHVVLVRGHRDDIRPLSALRAIDLVERHVGSAGATVPTQERTLDVVHVVLTWNDGTTARMSVPTVDAEDEEELRERLRPHRVAVSRRVEWIDYLDRERGDGPGDRFGADGWFSGGSASANSAGGC